MNIELNARYKLTSDKLNVIINEKRTVDPTKSPNWPKRQAEGASPEPNDKWFEVGYAKNIEQAVASVIDREQRASQAESMAEFLSEMRAIKAEILAAVKI